MPAPVDVTLERIVKREEWDGNDGTRMLTTEVLLEGENEVRKEIIPLAKDKNPQPGPTKAWIDRPGRITFADPNFTPRGGGGSGGGRSDGYDRRPDHPLVVAQRLHTSTLSAAPAYVEQMLTVGAAAQPTSADAYWALVDRTVAKLKETYPDEVLARATETNGSDSTPSPATPAKADEDIPF